MRTILFLILFCVCVRYATGAESVFDGALREGWSAGAWGGSSRAYVLADAGEDAEQICRIELAGDASYSGAFLMGGACIDLSADSGLRYLTFRVRGEKGGEEFTVVLRDGTERDGAEGYQSSVDITDYCAVTTDWQTVAIPLSDFPRTGVNWTLPPLDQLPHRREIDWARINMVGFNRTAAAVTCHVADLAFVAVPAGSGRPALAAPFRVAEAVDFSRGEVLPVEVRFSAPAAWEVEVRQGDAVRTMAGQGRVLSASWDGDSGTVPFVSGPAHVVLRFRSLNGEGDWQVSEQEVRIDSVHSPRVQVNQVGYLPGREKLAYVMGVDEPCGFTVTNVDGQVAVTGRSLAPLSYELAGGKLARIDLSALDAAGTYTLNVDGVGTSFPFAVGGDAYDDLFRETMKSYYYQRCGVDLTEPFAGQWTHEACHTGDAFVYEGFDGDIVVGAHIPSTGGWHDAGDYGKKIPPAASCLASLLRLAEMFPERIRGVHLNIPGDPEALPDYLREVKFGLDWFLTMQRTDGAVYHLITSRDFFVHDMPEKDPQPRYLVAASSCATADFAAAMAMAARAFRPFDDAYAAKCLDAALRAWSCLAARPEIFPEGGYTDPEGIHGTGTYGDKDDRDERFWAACELYVTTGQREFLDYIRAHMGDWTPLMDKAPSWIMTRMYGVHSLLLAEGIDEDLQADIRRRALAHFEHMLQVVIGSPYGLAIDVEPYWWNNATMLEHAAQFVIAHSLTTDGHYADAALRQMGYVLGCNPMDYCYVSGFGTRYPRDIWHAPSANDGIAEPVPGFVVPGPCLVAWGPRMLSYREENDLPVMKTYVDDWRNYSVNEVCLPFNAPMVFVAGYFALGGRQ
jgi:endoglucanase